MLVALKRPSDPAQRLLYPIVATVAGVLDVWLLVGWRVINPENLSWLGGDPADNQVGWEFLRHEPLWHASSTWIGRLDYPSGVSASYLDIIPIVAVPLHLFSSLLPTNFQYLGLYALTCFALQAYYGFKLTSLFSRGDVFLTFIGASFFLLSPVLTERLNVHFALLSQWIILASLYYYYRPSADGPAYRYLMPFVLIGALAAAIQPYIALMANLIATAAITRVYGLDSKRLDPRSAAISISRRGATIESHRGNWGRSLYSFALWELLIVTATVLSLVMFGFIVPGSSQPAGGDYYTLFSMNLLSPINPHGDALYFKQFPVFKEQEFEGYNYLGMGVLILLLITAARRPRLLRELWSPSIRPLTIVCIICTLLAVSLKVTFANHVLFTIPAPKTVFDLLSIFRGSGRLFWPVYYLLVLAGIVGIFLTVPSVIAKRFILASALLVQYFDLLAVRQEVAMAALAHHAHLLIAPDWNRLTRVHLHLVVLPAIQCEPETSPGGFEVWPEFATLAARSGMTLNSVYAARIPSETLKLDCTALPEQVVRNGLRPDTAYVLNDAVALDVLNKRLGDHYCRRVNGFNLCTHDPGRSSQSQLLTGRLIRAYEFGTIFQSEIPSPGSLLLDHFDKALGWGRWTIGKTAAVYFRLADPVRQDLRLELGFTNALLNRAHPRQRAVLSVNGHVLTTFEFQVNGANTNRTAVIPRRLIRNNFANVIRFGLPDAVSPKELGTGADDRLLALYLHRLRILPAEPDASGSNR
jgi:hypothetical protein